MPPGTVRYGAFLERGCVVMPSFVNIGSRVGARTMVDTWATVGSCAQIGADVHLSGGVGIGGVLEPPGARPVIVEDGAFLGSRSIVVEGCMVRESAVLGANVVLTASTSIIDVTGDEPVVHKGVVTISTESGDGRHANVKRELSGVFHAITGAGGRFKTGQIMDVHAEGLDLYNTMLSAMGASRRLGPARRKMKAIDAIRA